MEEEEKGMSLFTGAVLLGVVLAALTVGVWWKKTNVLELLVLGVVYWLCTWVISGMGLFVLDQFSLRRCVIAAVSVELLVGIAAVLVRKLRDKTPWKQLVRISWNVRTYWIPAVVLAGGFVLVAFKHELFGMGQDEGVYQTVAVNFLNGITDRQQDFAEYHTLSKEQQELFHDKVFSYLVGYDLETEDYPATVYDRNVSPVSGIYHGIPTYASMLAMWGKIFGMANMQGVQTLCYGCTIFLLFFLCQNLKIRKSSSALACAVFAASPIVVWVEKSALTESFLAVLLVLFLYLLTDEEHPYRQWLSIIPIAVFSCFHVSIYTMIPLFVVLYGGMFWITRRKSFAILMPVTLVGYCISFFAMRHVQPFYTMNNYRPFFVAGISPKDLPVLVPLLCGVGLVAVGIYLCLVYFLICRKNRDTSTEVYMQWVQHSKIAVVLVEFLLVALVLYIGAKVLTAENPLLKLQGNTLWGFVCGSGLFLLPIAWVVGVICPKTYLETPKHLVILVAACYCVVVYSAFLRTEVEFYYYYGRYLAPFMPIAAVFAALTLDKLRARVTLPVMTACLLFVSPFDYFLATHQDDTRMTWSVLEDLSNEIDSDDCVIVGDDDMWTLYLTLRATTGAAMYPEMEDPETQAAELAGQYDHVYYLGNGKWNDSFEHQFQQVYTNTITQSTDENYGNTGRRIIMFPLSYQEVSYTVSLYAYWGEEQNLSYPASTCANTAYYGFYPLEGNFCWSGSENASVQCDLQKRDYNMTVSLGGAVPLYQIHQNPYVVHVLVNGNDIGTITLDDQQNDGEYTLSVSKEVLHDGSNIVTFQSKLWKGSCVMEDDERELGIPLQDVEFEAA